MAKRLINTVSLGVGAFYPGDIVPKERMTDAVNAGGVFIDDGDPIVANAANLCQSLRGKSAPEILAGIMQSAMVTQIKQVKTLRVFACGDSHTNGHVPSVAVAGSEVLGTWGLNGPHDWQWNGTGFNGGSSGVPFRADSQQSSVTTPNTSYDVNSSVSTLVQSWVSWLPDLLRKACPSLLDVYIANYGVAGSSSYSWSGEMAKTYIYAGAQPNPNDTITIGGVTYTFVVSATTANQVQIGASAAQTNLNLINAINAEGTGWGAGTVQNPQVFAPAAYAAAAYMSIFARSTGPQGNSIAVSSSNQAGVTTVDIGLNPVASSTLFYGSNTSGIWANALANMAGGAGFGTPDVVLVTLGTNDAGRFGWRGQGFLAEMTKFINNIHAKWPNAQIILWKPTPSTAAPPWSLSLVLPAVAQLAATYPFVTYIDMNTPGLGSGAVGIVGNDGTHLSWYGYQLVAQLFAAAIVKVLPQLAA